MNEELKVLIIGDAESLEQAIEDTSKLYKKLIDDTKRVERELDKSGKASTRYANQIENLNAELREGTISQKQFEKQLERLQRAERNAARDTKRLENELENLNQETSKLQGKLPGLGKETKKLNTEFKNTGNTTLELGRIIQDSPFGVQGIANNVTQFTQNFGQLRKEAGGLIPALRAIGSSFLGPAGILIAVSTAVTLLQTFGDELLNVTSLNSELAKSTAEFTAQAQTEIRSLQTLLDISRDESLSKETRAKAIERINDNYSDYLGNLDLERISTDEVTTAVDNLTRSLLKQAQVRGAEALIEEKSKDLAEDLLELQLERNEAQSAAARSLDELRASNRTFQDFADTSGTFRDQLKSIAGLARGTNQSAIQLAQAYVTAFEDADQAVNDFQRNVTRELAPLQQIINELTLEDILAENAVTPLTAEVVVTAEEASKRDAKIQAERDKIQKELDKIAAQLEILDLEDAAQIAQEVEQIYRDSGAAAADALRETTPDFEIEGVDQAEQEIIALEKALQSLKKLVNEDTFNLLQGFNLEQLEEFRGRLQSLGETSTIFANAVGGAITDISRSTAEGIKTDSELINTFLGVLLNSLGQALAQIAQNAIQNIAIKQAESTANAIAAGSQTAAASGPAAAFVLPALIAASIATVVGAFGAIKFAQGGIVPGGRFVGDQIPALLNSGELVLNQGQQARLFEMLDGQIRRGAATGDFGLEDVRIEGELRGDTIFLSNQRAGRSNRRFST